MKKLKSPKAVIFFAAILLLLAAYLFYSRPMRIQQRYPMLTLDKCTELRGYYRLDGQEELTEFTIEPNSGEFKLLCDLLYEQSYRRSLRDIFPKGTRTHSSEPGDFQWEVFFNFEDVTLPDGNIGSGSILRIQSWYGELDIYFDDQSLSCSTADQEDWARQVLDVIR